MQLFDIPSGSPEAVRRRARARVAKSMLSASHFVRSVQVVKYDGHTGNITVVGFQKDAKWMYTGSEDGTVKIWDLRCGAVSVQV